MAAKDGCVSRCEGRGLALIVDDSHPIRRLVAAILENAGFATLQASTASEGLALFQSNDISLVISDLNLPGGANGAAFLRGLDSAGAGVKRILMSGTFILGQRVQGPFPMLAKPFRSADLLALLADLAVGAGAG